MRTIKFLTAVIALTVALPFPALAADGYLKAVHGIDGRDLGASKKFKVDVAVAGACALPNFEYGDITPYIPLPSGTYKIDISPADGVCGNSPVLSANARIRSGRFTTAVAHLKANGAPTATFFSDNQEAVRANYGRLTVRHTAAAPDVDVTVSYKKNKLDALAFSGVGNGQQGDATLAARRFYARLFPALGDTQVAGPVTLPIPAGANLVVYAVGSLDNGTFTFLVDAEALEHD